MTFVLLVVLVLKDVLHDTLLGEDCRQFAQSIQEIKVTAGELIHLDVVDQERCCCVSFGCFHDLESCTAVRDRSAIAEFIRRTLLDVAGQPGLVNATLTLSVPVVDTVSARPISAANLDITYVVTPVVVMHTG